VHELTHELLRKLDFSGPSYNFVALPSRNARWMMNTHVPTCRTAPSCITVATTESPPLVSQEQVSPVPEAGVHSWVRAKPSQKKKREPEEESHVTHER